MKSKIASGDKFSGKDRAKFLKAQREKDKTRDSQTQDQISRTMPHNELHEVFATSDDQILQEDSATLPAGFFDNEREEILARGLNVNDEIQKREESATETLQSFFEEVDNIDPDSTLLEEEVEHQENELIENAVQLAYSAKIGNLLLRCDPQRNKDGHSMEDLEVAAQEAVEILGQDHDLNERDDGAGIIQTIVETSLAKKKRKISIEGYEPIDLMDWTSKAIR
jgi:hypothetical protein